MVKFQTCRICGQPLTDLAEYLGICSFLCMARGLNDMNGWLSRAGVIQVSMIWEKAKLMPAVLYAPADFEIEPEQVQSILEDRPEIIRLVDALGQRSLDENLEVLTGRIEAKFGNYLDMRVIAAGGSYIRHIDEFEDEVVEEIIP